MIARGMVNRLQYLCAQTTGRAGLAIKLCEHLEMPGRNVIYQHLAERADSIFKAGSWLVGHGERAVERNEMLGVL